MNNLKSLFQKSLAKEFEYAAIQNDKQRTVSLIYLITITIGLIGGSVMYFYDMNSYLSLFTLGLVGVLGWFLNRAGYVDLSALILISILLMIIQFNIFAGYGIHDVAIIAWPAFIFFTGLLYGSQVIPYFTGLIMLLAVVSGIFPNAQLFSDYSDTGDLIVMLLILLAFSITAQTILRSNQLSTRRLQQAEDRFHTIYNSINDAILIHDPQTGAILDVNEKMSEMFGYTNSEAVQLGICAISSGIPPYTQENGLAWIKKTATLGTQNFEWQAKDKNGRLFWTDINMKLATIANRPQVLVSVRDITDRKQAEQALRENEEKYRRLFDNASLGIFQSSPTGKIISINPAFAHMLGYDSPEDAMKNIQNVATDIFADPNRRAEILRIISENPKLRTFENVYRRKDGSTFIGQLNLTPDRDSEGRLVRTEGMVEDITERKHTEARISAALEEKETLLREVHHRVKNNLQVIISLIKMRTRLTQDVGTLQFLRELESQAHTMALVYEQLYQSENLAQVNMAQYLRQLTANVLDTYGRRDAIQFHLDASLALDVAQATPCGLIVNELFSNILKYAFPPGFLEIPTVSISLHQDNETYHLTVSDNGVGLPTGYDWRAGQSMGLRLVNLWVTHQLGGTLAVSGNPGTTFAIAFNLKD